MNLLKTAAAGALAYFAYRAWQRRKAAPAPFPVASRDTGGLTPPHGDPTFPRVAPDLSPPAHATAQASRGFGADH